MTEDKSINNNLEIKNRCVCCGRESPRIKLSDIERKIWDEEGTCVKCGYDLAVVDELTGYFTKRAYFLCHQCDALYIVDYEAVSVKVLEEKEVNMNE